MIYKITEQMYDHEAAIMCENGKASFIVFLTLILIV